MNVYTREDCESRNHSLTADVAVAEPDLGFTWMERSSGLLIMYGMSVMVFALVPSLCHPLSREQWIFWLKIPFPYVYIAMKAKESVN